MPWTMSLRYEFVMLALQELANIRALCRRWHSDTQQQTGYSTSDSVGIPSRRSTCAMRLPAPYVLPMSPNTCNPCLRSTHGGGDIGAVTPLPHVYGLPCASGEILVRSLRRRFASYGADQMTLAFASVRPRVGPSLSASSAARTATFSSTKCRFRDSPRICTFTSPPKASARSLR
jgi:hypothetical protein